MHRHLPLFQVQACYARIVAVAVPVQEHLAVAIERALNGRRHVAERPGSDGAGSRYRCQTHCNVSCGCIEGLSGPAAASAASAPHTSVETAQVAASRGFGRSAPCAQGRPVPSPKRVAGTRPLNSQRGHLCFGEKGTSLLCVDTLARRSATSPKKRWRRRAPAPARTRRTVHCGRGTSRLMGFALYGHPFPVWRPGFRAVVLCPGARI